MLGFIKNLCFGAKEEECEKLECLLKPSRDLINYKLNDPTTPELTVDLPIPDHPDVMNIRVAGYDPKNLGKPNSYEDQAANVYATLVRSINNILPFRKDLKKWAATKSLKVEPWAGVQLNAYYDRRALKFFYKTDRVSKKTVYTAQSVDIVAHEMGHALLDAMRPDLWSLQALEVWAFHEAFGDINAIATVMLHDDILEYALKETNGDLKKHNVISRLAEEMGDAIYNLTGGRGNLKPGALRNAINDFHYVPPERLPWNPPQDKLGGEMHNFGRLMAAAWYDIVVAIYEHEVQNGKDEIEALHIARDVAYGTIVKGFKHAPANVRFYNSVAKSMIMVDRMENDGKYGSLIEHVFHKRRILKPKIKHLCGSMNFKGALSTLTENDEVTEFEGGKIITRHRPVALRLSDSMGISSQIHNPLFDCELEVPGDVMYEFGSDGRLIQHLENNRAEVLRNAVVCVKYLDDNKLVGDLDKDLFNVVEGKLVRTKFNCGCRYGE